MDLEHFPAIVVIENVGLPETFAVGQNHPTPLSANRDGFLTLGVFNVPVDASDRDHFESLQTVHVHPTVCFGPAQTLIPESCCTLPSTVPPLVGGSSDGRTIGRVLFRLAVPRGVLCETPLRTPDTFGAPTVPSVFPGPPFHLHDLHFEHCFGSPYFSGSRGNHSLPHSSHFAAHRLTHDIVT